MAHHSSELVFFAGRQHQAAVDIQKATRKGKGADRRVVDDLHC
jgi:hypothetical protein